MFSDLFQKSSVSGLGINYELMMKYDASKATQLYMQDVIFISRPSSYV